MGGPFAENYFWSPLVALSSFVLGEGKQSWDLGLKREMTRLERVRCSSRRILCLVQESAMIAMVFSCRSGVDCDGGESLSSGK